MKLIYHKNLRSTWFKYSYDEQMGNIGSEISRTKSALEKNDREMAYGALQRGLELIDLTLTDPRRKSKIVELKNARKTFLNCFNDYFNKRTEFDKLNKYFFELAYRCRVNVKNNVI